ncbi:fibronectin type III domain-containing protein [candidate division KSB1 bacterium]|nr:fibronectin type III domain-containing protein [candidate division KSB1 bacterium]
MERINYLMISLLILFPLTSAFSDVQVIRHIDLSANSVADHRMTLGDLNGDGDLEFVFNDGRRSIKAFDQQGNQLWQIFNPNDPGVEEIYHNNTISVYDIDLDGKAEVICYLEINSEHHLAILDGETGQVQTSIQVPFPAPRDHERFGLESYYMQDHIAIANLRGLDVPQDILAIHASKLKIAAYSYESGSLVQRWFFITDHWGYSSGHYAPPYDIDGDGRDEVLAGADILDENGNHLWSVGLLPFSPDNPDWGLDHVDAMTCADIDPDNPGMEIIAVAMTGMWLYAADGTQIWFLPTKLTDPVNGYFAGEGVQEVLVNDFYPDIPGLEMVIYSESMGGSQSVAMFDKSGNVIRWGDQDYGPRRWITCAMDWDGDRSMAEIYSRKGVFTREFSRLNYSMDWSEVHTIDQDEFPPLVADVSGDHREEILWYDQDEILILHNNSTLIGEALPSPWQSLKYRLRYANWNHCSPMYFDWGNLDSDPPPPPPPSEDHEPPNAPSNLTSPEQTENSIILNWMAPPVAADGDTACAYQIFQDGALLTTITNCQFIDNGLMDDTPYSYEIYACDDADNLSLSAATGTYVTVPIYFPHDPDPETSSITASVEMDVPTEQNNQRFLPISLSTSEIVVQVPNPLILQESDGSVTQILMQGNTPGTEFVGSLLITENLAGGEGSFHLHEGALVGTAGETGNEIDDGRQIMIDKEPPPCPDSLQILK